jgi:hypothetical protein
MVNPPYLFCVPFPSVRTVGFPKAAGKYYSNFHASFSGTNRPSFPGFSVQVFQSQPADFCDFTQKPQADPPLLPAALFKNE